MLRTQGNFNLKQTLTNCLCIQGWLILFGLALAVVLVNFQFLWNTSTSFRAHEKQLCASFNRLGREAVETDAEEIIEMAGKTSLSEQQKQVQENIHYQVGNFCSLMDGILSPDVTKNESGSQTATPPRRQSGLTFAVGGSNASPAADKPRKCFSLLESLCFIIRL